MIAHSVDAEVDHLRAVEERLRRLRTLRQAQRALEAQRQAAETRGELTDGLRHDLESVRFNVKLTLEGAIHALRRCG